MKMISRVIEWLCYNDGYEVKFLFRAFYTLPCANNVNMGWRVIRFSFF